MRSTRLLISAVSCFLLTGISASSYAATYTLAVQPFMGTTETRKFYTPMAKYLSEATGHTIKLRTEPNFLTYWLSMKQGNYDLLLDAAHLTDYRVKNMGYQVLAKVENVVSLSLVTHEDELVFEPSELVGKKIATLASPSRGAVVLDEFFTNPLRQPVIMEVKTAQDAVQKVLERKATGAIIPSPLVGNYSGLNVVTTTEQWPHVAMSVSPTLPPQIANKIQSALLNASKTAAGKTMLSKTNITGFEAADASRYAGYADVLRKVWGFGENLQDQRKTAKNP